MIHNFTLSGDADDVGTKSTYILINIPYRILSGE